MNRTSVIATINYYLTHLRTSVEHLNSLNLQDINVQAEMFYRDLLNLALGYELENINIVERNAQAIDLGDEAARVAIQVTSTADLSKIRHTLHGFVKSDLRSRYDRLIVLVIGERKQHREPTLEADGFSISLTDDVWGMSELLMMIGALPLESLESVRDFLRANIRAAEPRESNELITLTRLIEVLSAAHAELSAADNREDPDPEHKIEQRFADHAAFLQEMYVQLHEIYGRLLRELNQYADLGHVRIRKLQVYLMNWSDRVLDEHGGDPKAALDALVAKVTAMMGASDVGFDDGAIRYFLIDQLIACNVFPNKIAVDA